jgi:hypothetical protein
MCSSGREQKDELKKKWEKSEWRNEKKELL